MLNSKTIGNKITEARKKKNLSQVMLAQQVSISAQAVGKWERGESMPDILTLNRLAEILGVDLNYFSEAFQPSDTEIKIQASENKPIKKVYKMGWDMSKLNLADSDFSGLKNLHEKFCSSNMQRCLFANSEMSGLDLNNTNIEGCDFTGADMSKSKIQSSNLNTNVFRNCSLQESEFNKSNIYACDFSGADFTLAAFRYSNFMKNIISGSKWNKTSFVEMQFQDVDFDGILEDCSFENCSFYGVKFINATLTNTFFKNNKKFKKVQFVDCKADKITYAFLKNNLANLAGVSILT